MSDFSARSEEPPERRLQARLPAPHSGKPQTTTYCAGRFSGDRGRPIANRPQVANLSAWPCGPPKMMKTSPGRTSPDSILMQRPAAKSREVGA